MLIKLIALFQVNAINCSYFNILINSDASTSALQFGLIAKEKIPQKIFCLSPCSISEDCLTVVYQTTDSFCY